MPAIAGRPATVRTKGTKGTLVVAAMLATAGIQAVTHAAAVMSRTSNSKDINSMIVTTAGMQATARMKATTGPPRRRDANNS